MKTSISNLNGEQQNLLNHLNKNLKRALRPLMIICYGHRSGTIFKSSSFSKAGIEKKNWSAFDLVVLIDDNEVLPDLALQEIAVRNCRQNADDHVLVFRMREVLTDLERKNRFFASIFRHGILLHANKDALKLIPDRLPSVCFMSKQEKAHLFKLMKHAQQCLTRAEEELKENNADPYLSLLLLNESAIYAVRHFIVAHCGIEIRGELKDTLNFSVNINQQLTDIFPCSTIEEKLLFQIISLSFITEGYRPGPEILPILVNRIGKMISVSQSSSDRKTADLLPVENRGNTGIKIHKRS